MASCLATPCMLSSSRGDSADPLHDLHHHPSLCLPLLKPAREQWNPDAVLLGGNVERRGTIIRRIVYDCPGLPESIESIDAVLLGGNIERHGTVIHCFVYVCSGLQESAESLDAVILGGSVERRGTIIRRIAYVAWACKRAMKASML